MSDSNRARDLVLAPNEYAFICDDTKGNVNAYVGPYKTSLANTDKPVVFDAESKSFVPRTLEESKQLFTIAPEGWYVVLKNPASEGKQPTPGTPSSLTNLHVGRKVNLPGPTCFALWPGQMARVVEGHNLRYNQYLVVKVYDEVEAAKNWSKAVIKTKSGDEEPPETEAPDLTIGRQIVIKGAHVSFYIPPTGIEVVRDENGAYVREAVTLERMEYCILLDEDGNKRYVRGPAVVFPEPTEMFIEADGARKFRAVELNELSGIYIKVIAPYADNGKEYREGDELFITGKDQMIYYPREEHALIRYGDRDKHYAVAIPAGEGRYFLNRKTGTVTLQRGPCMFLPDPREAVIVRRIIEPRQCQMWFPGNQEALDYNLHLRELADREKGVRPQALYAAAPAAEMSKASLRRERASDAIAGDQFNRGAQFSPPRTITLDTKYEGAVNINIWTGYAVLVVSKTGARKVVVGPQTYLLEYDEELQAILLSTGTPKTEDELTRTVYLRVLNNKISDFVTAETADYCELHIHLSYRLNFEGQSEKWCDVENYVQFLCDHVRSLIRNLVRKHSVTDFYTQGADLLRDLILGAPGEGGKRQGRLFPENGMRVYDVEVLNIQLQDDNIEKLLVANRQNTVKQLLEMQELERHAAYEVEAEVVNRKLAETRTLTTLARLDLDAQERQKQSTLEQADIRTHAAAEMLRLQAHEAEQGLQEKINALELAIKRAAHEADIEYHRGMLQLELEQLKAEVEAVVHKAKAISPDLIAALQAFSDRALAERVAQSMAPLSILGGKSVAEVFANLLRGTPLGHIMETSAAEQMKEEFDELAGLEGDEGYER